MKFKLIAIIAIFNFTPTTLFAFQQIPFGFFKGVSGDPCVGTPAAGTVCASGAIFLGTLSPGATSGSGTNKYMTTPGGCPDLPAGSRAGGTNAANYYATSDFTVTCSGSDVLTKYWNNGSTNTDVASVTNYAGTSGTASSATNTDANYGSSNTTAIVTSSAAFAAASYCEKLSLLGYTDWYLPNRYELNLLYVNRASIPGLLTSSSAYWSSSESTGANAWLQYMNDGYQDWNSKAVAVYVRCVRRY